MNVAAVTMNFNEDFFLPGWIAHYSREVGLDNCFIVDHGSSDGIVRSANGAGRLLLKRSPMNDRKRTAFIGKLVEAMLYWYDAVIYSDTDEFLVADPERYKGIVDLCQSEDFDALTAIGMNVVHDVDCEAPFDTCTPALLQRRWLRPTYALCKPILVKRPTTWRPGFHISDHQLQFSHLYLFHLHHVDITQGLRKLMRTRTMAWEDVDPRNHQLISDEEFVGRHRSLLTLPRVEPATVCDERILVGKFTGAAVDFVRRFPEKRNAFYADGCPNPSYMLRVPERFRHSIPPFVNGVEILGSIPSVDTSAAGSTL